MSNIENVSIAHALNTAADAAENEAKAVTLNLAAAAEMRACFDREVITVEVLKGKSVATWASDDECIRAAIGAVLVDQKLDNASIEEALAAYRGNVVRYPQEQAKLNSAARRASNVVTLMASVALLERMTDAPMPIGARGMPMIPMAWFLPEDAADKDAHDILGDLSPWNVTVEATGPNGVRAVHYLTARGAGDLGNALEAYKRAVAAWEASGAKKKDKPTAVNPAEYLAILNAEKGKNGTSVSMLSINNAAKTWRARMLNARLRAEAEKRVAEAAKAQAEAEAARKAANAEADAKRKEEAVEAAKAAERAAEAARIQAEAAEAAHKAAEAKAATNGKRAVRNAGETAKPAGANGDPGTSLKTAIDMLWKAASADDYKRKFSADLAADWRVLADHVWMNPQLTEIFLAAREETLKRQAAEKREGSKAA